MHEETEIYSRMTRRAGRIRILQIPTSGEGPDTEFVYEVRCMSHLPRRFRDESAARDYADTL
jgi:hypothetical protein